MALITPTLPTIGEPRGDGETDVRNTLNTLVTLVNGNQDAANMADAFATDVVEPAFSTWKPLHRVSTAYQPSTSATTLLTPIGDINANVRYAVLPIDASEVVAGSRTTQLRLVSDIIPGGTAPGVQFTIALYLPTIDKVAGFGATVGAFGAAVTGSSITSSTVSTISAVPVVGPAFAFSTSNYYVVAATASGATAAGSITSIITRLQYRQV